MLPDRSSAVSSEMGMHGHSGMGLPSRGYAAVQLILAIKAAGLDYANLAGSLAGFVRAAAIADAAGIPCWHGSGLELGITTMAYVHACAVAKGCTLPSDLLGSYLREDDLIADPILCEDGHVAVPNEPGLGIELDTDALAKYAVE